MTRKHYNNPKRTINRPAKPKTSRANPPRPNRFGADPVGGDLGRPLSQTTKDAGKGSACALCPAFGRCGGCSRLDVPYADQLLAKEQQVAALFEGIAPAGALLPILGMDDPFHYRNKVISPYAPAKGAKRKGKDAKLTRADILTGMYETGTHRLIPTDTCAIENETAKKVTLAIRDIMARWGMEPYNEDTGAGFVRHAVVRVGHTCGEILVTLVTNGRAFPASRAFCRELVRRCPRITSVVQNVNERQTNVILGEREQTLYGPGFILDKLCGLSFRISSQSFYQVNAVQTEVLYGKAMEFAELTGKETVIDAYCGIGTIGMVAAKKAGQVLGVEVNRDAVRDARENAKLNRVKNIRFVCADAGDFMVDMANAGEHCDVLFMDPPRAGSDTAFLSCALTLAPRRIVYVSCNPETLARDLNFLTKRGYRAETIQPVDMFPHTDHVESIVMLEKKND